MEDAEAGRNVLYVLSNTGGSDEGGETVLPLLVQAERGQNFDCSL